MSDRDCSTPRDRVIASIDHIEPDICPYYIWFEESVEKMVGEYLGNNDFTNNYLHNHIAWKDIIYGDVEQFDDGLFRDSFGSVWTQGEKILHLVKPALEKPDLKGYIKPDIRIGPYQNGFIKWGEENRDRFRIVQLSMFFFERMWAMRGFEASLMDLYENQRFADKLLDLLEEICMELIEQLLRLLPHEIDAIGFSDDYGAQNNMLISPDMWRRFMKPHLRRMYEKIKLGGKYVYLHSCGHITPILPDLIELGVDILQPIQPEAMDIFDLKQRYGMDISFAGGISTQRTLPYGSAEDVRSEVDSCLNKMAKGGGYIMAPAKAVMPGVPVENIVSLINAFVRQEKQFD